MRLIFSLLLFNRLLHRNVLLTQSERLLRQAAVTMSGDIGGMRTPYLCHNEAFTEKALAKDPIAQFQNWFELACQTPNIMEANAVCLATATKDGRPSARMVLLKAYSQEGFKFFTNFESRKGKELAENPQAALTFFWEPLRRSVRIEGCVEKVGDKDAEEYFHSRPRDSQLSACVSKQSQPVAGRDVLLNKFAELKKQHNDETKPIPKPDYWGGFQLVPDTVEFWQGQTNRLHDRIKFRRLRAGEEVDNINTHLGENGWIYERLAP